MNRSGGTRRYRLLVQEALPSSPFPAGSRGAQGAGILSPPDEIRTGSPIPAGCRRILYGRISFIPGFLVARLKNESLKI